MSENVLDIQNLKVVFPNERGLIRAVEGIDLGIAVGHAWHWSERAAAERA